MICYFGVRQRLMLFSSTSHGWPSSTTATPASWLLSLRKRQSSSVATSLLRHDAVLSNRRFLSSSQPPWTQRIVSTLGTNFQVAIYDPPFDPMADENKECSATKQPVLCLPGALGTGPSDFQGLLEGGLGPGFQIIAVNPRGIIDIHCDTTSAIANNVVEREYPLDFYKQDAIDAAACMSELGFNKYHVLGWSDGANVAIHLAAKYHRHVDHMVIWGGNSYITQADCDAWESVRDINNWSKRQRESKAAIHGGLERLQILNNKATDGWINIYKNPQTNGDICLKELHDVRCPTLILHGYNDVICDRKHPVYMGRQIANSVLIMFAEEEAKHNIHQRLAESFNDHVQCFLHGGVEAEFLREANNNTNRKDPFSGDDEEQGPVIDEIAYAFMGSKTLFTALQAGVFDAVHDNTGSLNDDGTTSCSFQDIEHSSTIKGERLRTLINACVSLKLIRRRMNNEGVEEYWLPESTTDQLVKTSKRYWGDYILNQVSGQFYNRMLGLDDIMTIGSEATNGYEAWFESDPDAAKQYTQAQHNGSLATAYALHKRLPDLATKFPGGPCMLDVGGGSGAFSIATARKIPTAECVVLDLPNVTKVADDIIAQEKDASVQARVTTLSLSATAPGEWEGIVPGASFDVVLMSYVSGSIPAEALSGLYENAFRVLKPGGLAIIHDFFVDNHGGGPRNAALWALAHVTVNPEGMGLRPNRVVDLLASQGFVAPKVDDLIPGATQLISVTKPGNAA